MRAPVLRLVGGGMSSQQQHTVLCTAQISARLQSNYFTTAAAANVQQPLIKALASTAGRDEAQGMHCDNVGLDLKITGHSLGGRAAALLTMI